MRITKQKIGIISFTVIIMFGIYLRFDQFLIQVLIDDEWHAVHKIMKLYGQPIYEDELIVVFTPTLIKEE